MFVAGERVRLPQYWRGAKFGEILGTENGLEYLVCVDGRNCREWWFDGSDLKLAPVAS